MEHGWSYFWSILLILVSFFLIIIILLQRGRGGGLAGAFGGLGGQSAFGTKAGDVFTKITIFLAVIWVALAGLSGAAMIRESTNYFEGDQAPASVEAGDDDPAKKEEGKVPPFGLGSPFDKTEETPDSGAAKTSADVKPDDVKPDDAKPAAVKPAAVKPAAVKPEADSKKK